MSDRIVVDPESLRLVASRMRGGAELLSSTGRGLARRHLPAMPAAVVSIVTDALARVNAELQDLSAELVRESGLLSARAMWVELGEREIGWTGGGAFADAWPDDATAMEPGSPERAERWSIEVLEGAGEPMPLGDEDATRLRELVGLHGPVEPADDAMGDIAFAGGGADAPDDPFVATASGRLASGAALGNILNETETGPTGAGILGCIAVGLGTVGAGTSS